MMCLRWIVLVTLGLLSAGISTANDCEEAARSASGPTIGLNAAGPSVTVDVACHFTSATSSQTFTVSSTDLLMVAGSLDGTLLTLDPGYVGSATPGTATVTVSRGTESYAINVNVSSCVTAEEVASLPHLFVPSGQQRSWNWNMAEDFAKTGGGVLTYEASSLDESTFTMILSGSKLTLTGRTLPPSVGRLDAYLMLTARNSCGAAKVLIPVTVTENQRPTLDLPLGTMTLASHGYTAMITLSGHFSDPDEESLTYSVASSAPATVAGSIDADTLTVTTGRVTGTAKISVTATDTGGLAVSDTLDVTVTRNQSPTVTDPIDDVELTLGGKEFDTGLTGHFSDPEGGPLTFRVSAEDSGSWTRGTPAVTAEITGDFLTVTADFVDVATVIVTATDPGRGRVRDEFVVRVVAGKRSNPDSVNVRSAPAPVGSISDQALTIVRIGRALRRGALLHGAGRRCGDVLGTPGYRDGAHSRSRIRGNVGQHAHADAWHDIGQH